MGCGATRTGAPLPHAGLRVPASSGLSAGRNYFPADFSSLLGGGARASTLNGDTVRLQRLLPGSEKPDPGRARRSSQKSQRFYPTPAPTDPGGTNGGARSGFSRAGKLARPPACMHGCVRSGKRLPPPAGRAWSHEAHLTRQDLCSPSGPHRAAATWRPRPSRTGRPGAIAR